MITVVLTYRLLCQSGHLSKGVQRIINLGFKTQPDICNPNRFSFAVTACIKNIGIELRSPQSRPSSTSPLIGIQRLDSATPQRSQFHPIIVVSIEKMFRRRKSTAATPLQKENGNKKDLIDSLSSCSYQLHDNCSAL